MKCFFALCAFFILTTSAEAALEVIPPQQGTPPVISTLPAYPVIPSTYPAAMAPPVHSAVPPSVALPAHGIVTVEKSLAKISFKGTCIVKGNVEKSSPDFRPDKKGTTGSLKEIFAFQIPAGWTGTITEKMVSFPVTGVFAEDGHWADSFRKFLEINQLQGYVDVPKKHIYVQKIENTPVASALRDAEKTLSHAPLSEPVSTYSSLTAPAAPYSYAIRPGLLKGQLEDWCRAAQFDLIWLSKNDFQIQGTQTFGNDFQKSVIELFDLLYKEGRMSLKAQIFLGNKILRIRQD